MHSYDNSPGYRLLNPSTIFRNPQNEKMNAATAVNPLIPTTMTIPNSPSPPIEETPRHVKKKDSPNVMTPRTPARTIPTKMAIGPAFFANCGGTSTTLGAAYGLDSGADDVGGNNLKGFGGIGIVSHKFTAAVAELSVRGLDFGIG